MSTLLSCGCTTAHGSGCHEARGVNRPLFMASAVAAGLAGPAGFSLSSAQAATDLPPGKAVFMEEATRLAIESVEKGWGGPFGAVIVKDGEIIGRGQNRVLLTGIPVFHAEITAIMDASARLNPKALLGSDYGAGTIEAHSSGAPGRSRRSDLMPERLALPSSRRIFEPSVGRVGRRVTGTTAASRTSSTSRASASARFCSCVR